MATHVSPGVYTKIIDLSTYLSDIPGSIGFVPFLSRRGPDNKLVYITSLQEFADKYSKPNINDWGKNYGQGAYIAWNHITVAPSMYCMRCLPDDAAYSNLFIIFDKNASSETAMPAYMQDNFDQWSDSTGAILVGHEESLNSIAEIDTKLQANVSEEMYPICCFYPIGRGDSYDDFAISLTEHANTNLWDTGAYPWQKVYTVDIWETQSDGDDVIVETFDVSFDNTAIDDSGDSLYIEDVINKYSKFLRVRLNESNLNEWKKSTASMQIGDSVTPYHLYFGSEGGIVTVDAQTGRRVVNATGVNGATTVLSNAYRGLLTNPETGTTDPAILDLDDVYIPLVYDAGYPTDVKNQLVTLVSDIRQDGVGIIDNGDNANYSESIDARDNDHTYNTKYVALYESYSNVFDVHTGRDIWVSPVFHMASMIPLNDKLYEIWYASAGFNRGTIDGIKELRFSPNQDQRDGLYLKQINPIVKFSIGYTVWGQLTTQRRPSSLQDLNVMRMVLYIKRSLEQFCKWFIFEFNDEQTHKQVKDGIAPFLQTIKEARGLVDFSIDVGATEYEFKRKIMHVNVILNPNKVVERVELNLLIK